MFHANCGILDSPRRCNRNSIALRTAGRHRHGLPPVLHPGHCARMAERLSVAVCVVGAGPVGGTLACRLAAAGVPTAVVDRAPLPPMEHPEFDGRAYAIAAGSRSLLEAAGIWDRLAGSACPIRDIRVSDGRLGRPASPLFLHFDHRDAGETRIRPYGGGAQPAPGAERANACTTGAASVRPCRGRGGATRRRRHRTHRRWAHDRLPPRRCGGRPQFAASPRGGHPRHASPIRPDWHRLRDQPRAAAPQYRAGALPSLRPVRATADVRQPRRGGRRRAQRLRHRLDRAHADRPSHAGAR